MKYFYDTEFIDTGRTIDLISIGIVAEDGREYYGINSDIDVAQRAMNHTWLRDNVMVSLPFEERAVDFSVVINVDHKDFQHLKPKVLIARDVKEFICGDAEPELWAYYAAYDHVALAQLYGRMLELPMGMPMWTHDLKQEMEALKNPAVPQQSEGAHNALSDARWNKETYDFLQALKRPVTRGVEVVMDVPVIGAKQIYPPVANPRRIRSW